MGIDEFYNVDGLLVFDYNESRVSVSAMRNSGKTNCENAAATKQIKSQHLKNIL